MILGSDFRVRKSDLSYGGRDFWSGTRNFVILRSDFRIRISGLSYGGRDFWSGTRNFRILGSDFRVGSPDYCMEVVITDLVREILRF